MGNMINKPPKLIVALLLFVLPFIIILMLPQSLRHQFNEPTIANIIDSRVVGLLGAPNPYSGIEMSSKALILQNSYANACLSNPSHFLCTPLVSDLVTSVNQKVEDSEVVVADAVKKVSFFKGGIKNIF